MFSPANVEKVVKPPHRPTIRNNLHSFEMIAPLSASPTRNPRNKLPETFTTRVPRGNSKIPENRLHLVKSYLATVPMKPPVPTSSIVLSMFKI